MKVRYERNKTGEYSFFTLTPEGKYRRDDGQELTLVQLAQYYTYAPISRVRNKSQYWVTNPVTHLRYRVIT